MQEHNLADELNKLKTKLKFHSFISGAEDSVKIKKIRDRLNKR